MRRLLTALIRFYRRNLSPLRPPCCRFIPTCSEYALEAVEKYGGTVATSADGTSFTLSILIPLPTPRKE